MQAIQLHLDGSKDSLSLQFRFNLQIIADFCCHKTNKRVSFIQHEKGSKQLCKHFCLFCAFAMFTVLIYSWVCLDRDLMQPSNKTMRSAEAKLGLTSVSLASEQGSATSSVKPGLNADRLS